MALDRQQTAERLRQARKDLGFTQAEVAEALGVHRPTISEIEAGRRAVTSEELHRFCELYAIPVSRLISEEAPTGPDVERILFRATTLESAPTRVAVRKFIERCRVERELEELLGVPHPDDARPAYRASVPENKLQAVRQGYRIAEQERRRLELGIEPLRNPLELLERQGVRIGPLEDVGENGPDGIYFETDELGPCVGVNPARDPGTGTRSAFTATHEYAHWLLRDTQVEEFDFQVEEFYFDRADDDLREVRANVFAAAFLMPEKGLEEYFTEAGLVEHGTIPDLSRGDIVQAMDHFGVSREALLWRLHNAGLMDEPTTKRLLQNHFSVMQVAEALGLEFRKPGPFGTRLRSLAIKAWKKGLISTGRAAELLDLDIQDFRRRMTEIGEAQEASPDDIRLGAASRE